MDSSEKTKIRKLISELIQNILINLSEGKLTRFIINPHKLDKIFTACNLPKRYKIDELYTKKGVLSQIMIVDVLISVYIVISTETRINLRSIFYQNVNLFQSQRPMNLTVDSVSYMLNVNRNSLSIETTRKGLIYGPLKIFLEKNVVDCSTQSVSIPDYTMIKGFQASKNFVILIEKETIFNYFINKYQNEPSHKQFIIVTARGMPDINTRGFLKLFINKLNLSVYALMDPDPYGIHIYMIYKYGSKHFSHENETLTCDNIQWLGVFPSDFIRFPIHKLCFTVLTENDKIISNRLWMEAKKREDTHICQQIEMMVEIGLKAEIESLLSSNYHFLKDVYMKRKLDELHLN